MIERSQIESFMAEAGAEGDRGAVAVCRLALGWDLDRVAEGLDEHETYLFEQLNLDESPDRAAELVGSWIDDAQAAP